MEIVISPVARQVWRSSSTLQIGFGENSVILENLQPRHEAMIDALRSGLTPEQARNYSRHLKMRVAETQALITALKPVLLKRTERFREVNSDGLTLDSEIEKPNLPEILPLDSSSYLAAAGEINQATKKHSARGETVWLRRQSRAVFVPNLDQTGLMIAEALASAGIGALVSGDITETRLHELASRTENLTTQPQVVTLPELTEQQIQKIDLAILIGQEIIEPQKFAAWMNRGTPQIAAIFASAAEGCQPLVSHVIRGGITPCWICLEQERCARDAAWPQLASQIVCREQRYDSAVARMNLVAKLLERALGYIDQQNGFGKISTEAEWNFSSECSCRLGSART